MSRKPAYLRPVVQSFDREAVREMLGPATCQYSTVVEILPSVDAENGTVTDLTPFPRLVTPVVAAPGDGLLDVTSQGFASFDLGVIPAPAIIDAVEIILSPSTVVGAPLTDLGSLVVAEFDYGTLDAADFGAVGTPVATVVAFPASPDVTAPVAAAHAGGSGRWRITLYFGSPGATDGAGDVDQATFDPGDLLLRVTYH